MPTIFDVAKYVLSHYEFGVSTKKIQKLCYMIQGIHLATTDEPIFNEDFHLAASGPVCRELYEPYKDKYTLQMHDCDGYPGNLTKAQKALIDLLVKVYGNYQGNDLEEFIKFNLDFNGVKKGQLISKTKIEEQFKNFRKDVMNL